MSTNAERKGKCVESEMDDTGVDGDDDGDCNGTDAAGAVVSDDVDAADSADDWSAGAHEHTDTGSVLNGREPGGLSETSMGRHVTCG